MIAEASTVYLLRCLVDDHEKFRHNHVDTFHDWLFEFGYLHLYDILECFVGREETRSKNDEKRSISDKECSDEFLPKTTNVLDGDDRLVAHVFVLQFNLCRR